MSEAPNTVHGRLLESVHLSGYSFERACGELEWLLDKDRWKEVAGGYDDVDAFLSTIDFSEFRIAIEQRKKLAKRLAAIQASQRATAKVLGVSDETVARDLGKRDATNVVMPPADSKTSLANNDTRATNVAPDAWFEDEIDPAKAAKTKAARAERESGRERQRHENAAKVATVSDPRELLKVGRFSTIVIDPPWDLGDEGDINQMGRAKQNYRSMPIDEVLALPVDVLSDSDCHLYLWITNRSLPKGFRLLEAWGFRYVTCLTWAKPSFGMGNYFRGQTEHLLFGLKGSLQLKRKDVGTIFHAPRGDGGHSSKPVEFYELVESCSPEPYLEMFSRQDRSGWTAWGENS